MFPTSFGSNTSGFGVVFGSSPAGGGGAGFGFGAGASGGLSGASAQPAPLFGQAKPTGFVKPMSAEGTARVKYAPLVGTDEVVKSGYSQNINVKHQCITSMKEYENKSLEELRLEDYSAGRGGSPPGSSGGPRLPLVVFGLSTEANVFGGYNGGWDGGLFGNAGARANFGAAGGSAVTFSQTHSQSKMRRIFKNLDPQQINRRYPQTAPRPSGTNFSDKLWMSPVYQCGACALCFERPESVARHFNNCLPFRKIPRVLCVCGLQFDTHNFDYHCEVHRKFIMLSVKIITVKDDKIIRDVGKISGDEVTDTDGARPLFDVGKIDLVNVKPADAAPGTGRRIFKRVTMGEKVDATKGVPNGIDINTIAKRSREQDTEKAKETVATARDKFKTDSSAVVTGVTNSAEENEKASVVYKCRCELCFDRPDFLFKHLNNCSGKKTMRNLCVCELQFDQHNIEYHRAIHDDFTTLIVKKIIINVDKTIYISGMAEEFAEDDKTNVGKTSKVTLNQTVDENETLVKSPAVEHASEDKETAGKLLDLKIVRTIIDTIESGIHGKEDQRITIIIESEREKTHEYPNKNEVTEIRNSETNNSQKASNNTKNDETAPTEEDEKPNDNNTSDIASNETADPNGTENKAANSGGVSDIGTAEDTEQQNETINTKEALSVATHDISAPTETKDTAIDVPETADVGLIKNTELVEEQTEVIAKQLTPEDTITANVIPAEQNNEENSKLQKVTKIYLPSIPFSSDDEP